MLLSSFSFFDSLTVSISLSSSSSSPASFKSISCCSSSSLYSTPSSMLSWSSSSSAVLYNPAAMAACLAARALSGALFSCFFSSTSGVVSEISITT
ncbi:hypothetical protein RO3G_00032 [Rhizopus delemar RA 99-880]|uniref:Uncharacterized protein n=1 Tax=Rhizopus delemar (strain RA 99-880 / ATCC MYA-4621 / FGSC 9543 / NRRL 43880) TaxID=246409 RepID=I1BGJ8_RHIO9|nr:hypothetical protein RO3G_00032 [Rhizopus delemar RA 99-880]|eukprot:EIE75328.1 hypothetical protein RO3G_00032 [Rhizopus delemar RA 99-880]